jgi:hypothetical protein
MWYLKKFMQYGSEAFVVAESCKKIIIEGYTLLFENESKERKEVSFDDLSLKYNLEYKGKHIPNDIKATFRDVIKNRLDKELGVYTGLFYDDDCLFTVDDWKNMLEFLSMIDYEGTFPLSDFPYELRSKVHWYTRHSACCLFVKEGYTEVLTLLDIMAKDSSSYYLEDDNLYFVSSAGVLKLKIVCDKTKFFRFITKYKIAKG